MPSDGNVDFTENDNRTIITLYDLDMNQLFSIETSQTKNILAGSYIIKIINEYSNDSVTVYGIP
jgi:hypothetical protein